MHLNIETALDLMEGRLETTLEHQWTSHLASCIECEKQMEEWQALRLSLKRPHLESAPELLLKSAAALFQPPARTAERMGLRQIIATVLYDSFAQPSFAGARGATATRQVVLRAEEFDIHVRIWATSDSRELIGQIQPRGTTTFIETARLHLLQNGERISSAEVNDIGEFRFSFIPEGFLSLQIDLPHLTVIGALDATEQI